VKYHVKYHVRQISFLCRVAKIAMLDISVGASPLCLGKCLKRLNHPYLFPVSPDYLHSGINALHAFKKTHICICNSSYEETNTIFDMYIIEQ